MGPVVTAVSGASGSAGVWHFEMSLPDSHPSPAATVQGDVEGRKVPSLRLNEARAATSASMCRRPVDGSAQVAPTFVPGANGDDRELTLQLIRCQLRQAKTGKIVLEV